MKLRMVCAVVAFLSLNFSLFAQRSSDQASFTQSSAAQASGSSAASAQVPPPLIQFSNVANDENGNALTGAVNITFSLYSAQQGGEPLWSETQNEVQLDSTGHYTVQLGSTQPNGVPTTLFASGEARWLGVQIAEQPPQPRVLLLSVPYALKAGDAQTIGGLPPSAFARVNSGDDSSGNGSLNFSATPSASGVSPAFSGGGTKGYLAAWSGSTSLTDSLLFETPLGNIGVSTTTPSQKFQVSSGNLLVQGPSNFVGSGSTATVYVGDVNHQVEAISHSGLALGAYEAPQALFIADYTGDVGIGVITPTGASLSVQSNSTSNVGAAITGFNAPSGSNLAGYDGAHISGGSPDPNASSVNGGVGLVASGGSLSGTTLCCYEGTGGTGIVANGGGSGYDGTGGTGLIANGAGGGAGGQGAGVIGTGGGSGLTAGAQGISGYGGSGGTCDLCGGGGAGGSFDGGAGNCLVIGEPNCDGDGVDATTADGGVYNVAGGYAGNFTGDINVTGTVYNTISEVKIDHPLDPANKYLQHASVESSEMMNLYTGNVTTDGEGRATVKLPEWFEAVNTDFRYQLTVIGQFAQAIVAHEIQNHEFAIRTSVPNVKVSWQVTGVRHDAFAKANPLVVEQAKERKLRGYYIHPGPYGAPSTKQIEWARNPELMKQMAKHTQEMRAKRQAALSSAAQPQAGPVSQ